MKRTKFANDSQLPLQFVLHFDLCICFSPDLSNFFVLQNAKASYDFSSNDPFPYPRYTDDWFNR